LALANNTSTLSWLQHATRTKGLVMCRLPCLLSGFLSTPSPASYVRVQGKCIPSLINTKANLLSHFELAPLWESAMTQPPNLQFLPTCRLPCPRRVVQNKHDRSAVSRARTFCSWLFLSSGCSGFTPLNMSEPKGVAVLAACLDNLAHFCANPQSDDPVQVKTLNLHLQAAIVCL